MFHQEAIKLTKDNVSVAAERLIDYTAQDLLDEYNYMLTQFPYVVLGIDVMDDVAMLSYVVTQSSFDANARTINELNDQTYETVVQL